MATALDLSSSTFPLNPDPPDGYDRKFIIFLQIRYSIDDTNPDNPYVFEYQFERRVPDDDPGFFMQNVERSGWTVIELPDGVIDIKIKGGDAFVVIETVPNGAFADLFWSINNEAIMTQNDRTSLYGDLKYGDGNSWQERADYVRDHPGDSTCRWISFKARLNPNNDPHPSNADHKFSYNFYLRNPQGDMQDLEVDPDIKNPSV